MTSYAASLLGCALLAHIVIGTCFAVSFVRFILRAHDADGLEIRGWLHGVGALLLLPAVCWIIVCWPYYEIKDELRARRSAK